MARTKGTTPARGYGYHHQQLRKQWARHVATGLVQCPRCGLTITPGTAWDLGHTEDRQSYTGPEHRSCNRSEGASRGNRMRQPVPVTSRRWW